MELELRSFTLTEIRAIDGDKPIVEGHAAVFGVKSHDMGFREIIERGAFAEAVKSDDVKFLLNHEGLPLARTKSRTLRLSEDDLGLAFRAELDASDPDVQRLLPKVRRGDLSEMSFAFAVRDRSKDERWHRDKDELVRTLFKVSLFDVSAVTYPAYPSTDLQARSYFAAKMAELKAVPLHAIASDELEKAEFRKRIAKARAEFIAARTPPPDPFSYHEAIKKSRIKQGE